MIDSISMFDHHFNVDGGGDENNIRGGPWNHSVRYSQGAKGGRKVCAKFWVVGGPWPK